MSAFDEFEDSHATDRVDLFTRMAERVLLLERQRPWIVAFGVVAALVAAFSRLDPTGTLGLTMAICGGVLAAASGLAVAVLDFKKLEFGTKLKDAGTRFNAVIAVGHDLERKIAVLEDNSRTQRARMEDFVRYRRSALRAFKTMHETAERCDNTIPVVTVIEAMLDAALADLCKAFGFAEQERWTISIFSLEKVGRRYALRRRVSRWWDKTQADSDDRHWNKGEGFVGRAWSLNEDVIFGDTGTSELQALFSAPATKLLPLDKELFRSIAVLPIRYGPKDAICGVISVTSDCVDQFIRNDSDPRARNVDVVRQLEAIFATQIALRCHSSKGAFHCL